VNEPIRVPIGRGTYATSVDEADLPKIAGYNWYRHSNGHGGWYVRGYLIGSPKPYRYVYMHALIMGIPGVDHVNGDGLDNTRINLREASRTQQGANQGSRGGTSQFKGVYRTQWGWVARITVERRQRYLGKFPSEEEAARAYDAAAIEAWGEYARLNLPAH
jgi:hypothetical protein